MTYVYPPAYVFLVLFSLSFLLYLFVPLILAFSSPRHSVSRLPRGSPVSIHEMEQANGLMDGKIGDSIVFRFRLFETWVCARLGGLIILFEHMGEGREALGAEKRKELRLFLYFLLFISVLGQMNERMNEMNQYPDAVGRREGGGRPELVRDGMGRNHWQTNDIYNMGRAHDL